MRGGAPVLALTNEHAILCLHVRAAGDYQLHFRPFRWFGRCAAIIESVLPFKETLPSV